ncbi:MAG: hypothetical protein AAB221_08545, partial [Bacteroidota bacterium]
MSTLPQNQTNKQQKTVLKMGSISLTKKGMERASADVGFMFIAYNLRRIINLIDHDVLIKFFRELVFLFLKINASAK